ncbi:MAG: hypothetical protein F6K63_11170 [Moorea sp. SIO1G6]|uniref:hypothetical protein n=1 Tax=Moorena sp. SIO1G6 TaxID=2607840 RepID=UPI0013BFDC48|nr:hypothetical protein [Moorena sp. SIO1G6]NET64914.1 hypothetical protein [Moorena sp. SIO1G6]
MVHRILPHSTTPCSLLPAPCSLLPIPYSLFPIPDSLKKFVTKVFKKCYNEIFFVL